MRFCPSQFSICSQERRFHWSLILVFLRWIWPPHLCHFDEYVLFFQVSINGLLSAFRVSLELTYDCRRHSGQICSPVLHGPHFCGLLSSWLQSAHIEESQWFARMRDFGKHAQWVFPGITMTRVKCEYVSCSYAFRICVFVFVWDGLSCMNSEHSIIERHEGQCLSLKT
jgi:hypothetical protein